MPPKHKFNYVFTDTDGKEIKIQPSDNLILNYTLVCVSVCKCPRCGAEAPIFKRDEDDHLLYGHCPNCDFQACKGGEDLKSAADGWNKTVEFAAQDLYWRLTQTGPYAPEEKHDEP